MSTDSASRLTVSQVCRRYPGARGAKYLSPPTVTRWILHGCPARDGTRVRLAAIRCGSRWLVDPADLDAFFLALAVGRPETLPPHQPAAARRRTSEHAVDTLKRRGA